MHNMKNANGPVSGHLSAAQLRTLQELIASLSHEQLVWVRGYLAAVDAQGARSDAPQDTVDPQEPAAGLALTILYGSETGNSRQVAEQARAAAQAQGLQVAVVRDLRDVRRADWRKFETVLLVISTHGEGDPPDSARESHALLHSKGAPRLEHLRYAVLALGDTSYDQFCQAGREFDQRLSDLGAQVITPRVDCDVDFEEPAAAWIETVLRELASSMDAAPSKPIVQETAPARAVPHLEERPGYSRRNPVEIPVLENHLLTADGSSKEVRHIEFSLEQAGLEYQAGDVLYVLPNNHEEHVSELIEALGAAPAQRVTTGSDEIPLVQALAQRYEITKVTRPFLERYAERSQAAALREILDADNKKVFRGYVNGRHVVDVLREFPLGLSAQELIDILRRLPPRAYSIASSNCATPGEVHLTVGVTRYHGQRSEHRGVASGWLADLDTEQTTAPVYVKANEHFRLPKDPDTPIIMIGSGTGIAPYRGFLAERQELGAQGNNWLFFGDRNFRTDFLYQREWIQYRDDGVLTNIDVAFSRDGVDKRYVQHRLEERSRELYEWLQEGAHLYVCGATAMADDVHSALLNVVRREADISEEDAHVFVHQLQDEHRYHRDVY